MSTDLLDFFAAPTSSQPQSQSQSQSQSSSSSSSSIPNQKSNQTSKKKPTVESSEESASEETFDFTSGLKKDHFDNQSNFGHNVEEDDAWDTLAQRGQASTASQTNKEFKIAPDSFLYRFNKEVEKIGVKINATVTDSQKSIDRFDAKHGVTQKVLKKIEKYDLSHRLDVVGSDLTEKADKLSADIKDLKVGEKVKKGVKQAKKKLKVKKKSGDSSSDDSSDDEAERTKEKQKRKKRVSDASKNSNGQFISIGAQDRIPGPDDSSYSEMSGNEMTPRKSQQAVVESFNKAFSKEKPKVGSTSSTSSGSSNGSSLTYQPKSSAASRANGLAPPPPAPSALFAMPAGLRAHEEEEEEEGEDTQEPPLSPLSFSTPSSTSHANSREHSFNFNSLRFDDVHLSDREH